MLSPRLLLVLLMALPVAPAEPSVQQLVDRLKSDREQDRIDAARRLGQLGTNAKEASPALADALKDKMPQVRFEAAFALLHVDQRRSKEIFAALTTLLEDKTAGGLHFLMLHYMGSVQPASPEVVKELLALAHNKHPLAPVLAGLALERLGPQSAPAADLLVEALKDSLGDIRLRAAIGLLRIDRKYSAQAVPVLRALCKDDKAFNRLEAASLLVTADPGNARAALTVLKALLKHADSKVQRQTIDVLASLGSPALEAEADLKALVKGGDALLAAAASEALMRLRPDQARGFFGDLLAGRDRADNDGIRDLMRLIEKLHDISASQGDRERLKTLTEQLRRPIKRSNSDVVHLDAVIRLADMGPRAGDAVGDLVKATAHPSPAVRAVAVYALGQVGPEAKAAVPRLRELIETGSPDLREAASKALGRIDPDARKQDPR